ncbi:putative maltose fermentation regulatory protein [Cladorrhinum sp. PSN332]|nr:putative maltose fermentation regulatory protein [Cladorrhinum sp. PSN332]
MTTAVKRACDACHRRKVRCDGVNPCSNCTGAALGCTYLAVPQKKGPKGSRAKVINELKEKQQLQANRPQNGINGASTSPSLAPTPRLLTKEMINACVEFFFNHMYPSMPILDRGRLEHDIMYADQDIGIYCLLTSFCAFVSLQPGMVLPNMGMSMNDPFNPDMMMGGNILTSTNLMEETIRVRKGEDFTVPRTLNTLCTDFFLFAVHHGLEMHDKAWFYLRQATTLAHISRMNEEPQSMQYDAIDASRCRRLYWLLFVTERAYALQLRRPLTLEATISLPSQNDNPSDPLLHHLPTFLRQIQLFQPFDHGLVSLWMKTRGECSEPYLSDLEKRLHEVLPPYLNDTQSQLAEMPINMHWLKDTAWKLGIANGNGHDAGLSYTLPQSEITQLLPMVSQFPVNLGLGGLGLVEKLLTVTADLAEVLATQPAPRTPFTPGPQDQLRKILNIVTILRAGDSRYLPLLLSKVHAALPKLASPMLQNAPETAPVCSMDIFDGFGSSTICQPAGYDSYDNKFAVSRMDDRSSDHNSPNGAPSSNNDMNSPFVSSPPIMSPGMDGLPHIQTDFTTMPEMVMSPITHAPQSLGAPGVLTSQQSQHQHQHTQQTPLSPFPNLSSQMQGMNPHNINSTPSMHAMPSQMHLNQGFGGGIGSGIHGNGMIGRPSQQRANSYAMGHHPPPIRTVGDFQALQRTNSDMNPLSPMATMGMSTMGGELDFNTLPTR